jgi:DNA-binding CsgD family transcriptional regulator
VGIAREILVSRSPIPSLRALPQFLTPLLDQATDAAVAALGRARFDAEFSAGRGLSRDDAFRLAFGESARAVAASSDRVGTGVLAKREIEVALLADGLTNKQIGVRLFISEKTVASHVSNILNKLGFSSRAQIPAGSRPFLRAANPEIPSDGAP